MPGTPETFENPGEVVKRMLRGFPGLVLRDYSRFSINQNRDGVDAVGRNGGRKDACHHRRLPATSNRSGSN
jgi:hypothetical protein